MCLAYHSGQVEYVPGIITHKLPGHVSLLYLDLFESLNELADGIQLVNINLGDIGTDNDRYRQCLLGFLQDAGRSGKYAIGPHTYTKATSFFMEEISRRYPESREWKEDLDEEESYFSDYIEFDGDIWAFDTTFVADNADNKAIFLFQGYIIFFLPKCLKSERILEYCKQKSFIHPKIIQLFPRRAALLRQAMQDYLDRVGSEFPLECGEDSDDWSDMEEESDDSSDTE